MFKLIRLFLLLGLGASGLAQAALVAQGDGTVSDTVTGLMWDQCSYGQSGADCAGATAFSGNWASAMVQASTANSGAYKGYSDWRLPNKKELDSIVDRTVFDPAITASVFPNTLLTSYWSSTTLVPRPSYAWAVRFGDGNVYGDDKTVSYPIRLVRGGPDSAPFDRTVSTDATCGSAHSTSLVTRAPSSNLCDANSTADTVIEGDSAYTWTCSSKLGGSPASCSASRGYTVTPSAGTGGSLSPSTAQVVAYGDTVSFSATASSGYTLAGVSGCAGALTDGTYLTGAVTQDCTVSSTQTLNTAYTGTAPSGSGNGGAGASVGSTLSGGGGACGFASVGYQTAAAVAKPPAGLVFPHGVLAFSTNHCVSDSTITITLTYPEAVPANARLYKYGPPAAGQPSQWYEHPATVQGNTVTYQVKDGGAGDSNDTPGVISDPAGMAVPDAAALAAAVAAVPALGPWGLAALAGLMGLMGAALAGRRAGRQRGAAAPARRGRG